MVRFLNKTLTIIPVTSILLMIHGRNDYDY